MDPVPCGIFTGNNNWMVNMNSLRDIRWQYSQDYRFLKGIAKAADYSFLDPILGFIIPGFGDILTAILTIPFVVTSVFKIRSIPLTLSIIYNAVADLTIGLFPIFGDVLDIFHKSYKRSYEDIVGFIEGDEYVIQEINNKAFKSCIMITILCIIIRLVSSLIVLLITWLKGLF